ncbi:Ldh family oxidoreductase [Microvirga sp. M2]|uniref:Ldh family oxidoreductase n=1 Tax=Microvirga sp. M2 TaxID=3073270 RepID=UPI0039C3E9F0
MVDSTYERYSAGELIAFGAGLMHRVGVPEDRADRTVSILVEGDLLGHTTHGLALLPAYLDEVVKGSMATDVDVEVINDFGASAVWDGNRLPGPWLVSTGIELGLERVKQHGSFALAIRRSHHIGCLAAYLTLATDQGCVVIVSSSDPSVESVAPFGGTARMITPNPIAAGFPTSGQPILLDISMSTTTNAMVTRAHREGRDLPFPWLLDARGNATSDPSVFFAEPPGSILPLGGKDLGYKGFGLGLLIEALTSGLAGRGRADPKEGWGASVFIQLFCPEFFGGSEAFRRQMDFLVTTAHASPTATGHERVRLPGERALEHRHEQLRDGVALHPSIMPALHSWAGRLGVESPVPVTM